MAILHLIPLALTTSLAIGAELVVTPTGLAAGGGPQSSASYQQFASQIGGIDTTAVASATYTGRHGYVGQLPEPPRFTISAPRYYATRDDGTLIIHILRSGDEDDPVRIGYGLHAEIGDPTGGMTPGTGSLLFDHASSMPLTLAIGPGEDATVLLSLDSLGGDVLIGDPGESIITIESLREQNPFTSGPRIISEADLVTASGETWVYDIELDPNALPHALNVPDTLEFSLIDAPPGMTITPTSRITARITWTNPDGEDEHGLIHLRVRDTLTGIEDRQEVLLFIIARPGGGG